MRIFVIKKRYVYVCFFVLFLICGIMFLGSKTNETLPTNASPILNKTIVLDAGHGLPDKGTMGRSGVSEQELNLQVVLKLQEIIEQSGAKVVLTRSDENGIYEVDKQSIRSKKISDMNKRVDIGNNSDANIFVSIHMNYYTDSKYSGWQTFYQSNNKKSKMLANLIQNALNENIEMKKRNPMAIKGAYIMDNVKIPAVIVECGFLSNKKEEDNIKKDEYQAKLAWGIYIGIQKYFMEEK